MYRHKFTMLSEAPKDGTELGVKVGNRVASTILGLADGSRVGTVKGMRSQRKDIQILES
jgi:hypothetical protein